MAVSREEIIQLQAASNALEPEESRRRELWSAVHAYSEDFISQLQYSKGFEAADTSSIVNDLPIREEARDLVSLLATLKTGVDTPGINPASGGHIGYIPGGGLYPSALGDFLADITNRYAGIYFGSPGAVRVENQLVRWMADLVGYPAASLGTLTSGGSIANLIGLATGRDALEIRSRDIPDTVIYLSDQTHHCVAKAIRIVGMRECIVRHVPLDARYRMNPQALEALIKKDLNDGLRPAMLIASLGSTDTGAVDCIADLSAISQRYHLWLQVDGAYGGFFQLVPELGHLFRDINKTDAYILDPHKGLFLPYGSGAVLIREGRQLLASQWYQASYLQDATAREEISPAELSPELTRPFRGLRMWLPLQLFGVQPFRMALTEKWKLALYFYEEIQSEGFEVGPTPELSVVIYRWTGNVQDPNTFNRMLVAALHQDGRIFVTSTTISGTVWLRLAVLSYRTHLEHIDLLLEMLRTHRDQLISKV